MDRTAKFYASPSYSGGAFPVFAGSRRRRGGSILGAIRNFAMPMIRGLARKGATQALGLAKDVASDVVSGRNFKSSLLRHGLRRVKRLGTDVLGSALSGAASHKRHRRGPSTKARQTSKRRRRTNF